MTVQDQFDPWSNPEFEQAVRDTAYFLWENDGRPEGREQDYWFAALDKCLRQRDADRQLNHGLEHRDGHQIDDNIDDLGRNLSERN